MHWAAFVVLEFAAGLILLGGLYDVLTPRLPPNLHERCGMNHEAQELVRALLRALGGCLIAIGLAVGLLAWESVREGRSWSLVLALVLVLPSEGLNALGMRRVGSPYYLPLGFILITVTGVVMAAVAGNP